MIIFNTTFHVEDSVCNDYINYMKDIYIPEAVVDGSLSKPRFARIQAQHEESGNSYSLQFQVENAGALDRWFKTQGPALQKEIAARFGNKVLGFVTLLEEIEL
ncbi:MAG: DUF4286 family protein [Prevotella sp.]|jgi:hypothetical protein|nr:DUF4286 family protein [Prevotella sp.]